MQAARSGGFLKCRQLLFDGPDSLKVLVEAEFIRCADDTLHRSDLFHHRIEDAALDAECRIDFLRSVSG